MALQQCLQSCHLKILSSSFHIYKHDEAISIGAFPMPSPKELALSLTKLSKATRMIPFEHLHFRTREIVMSSPSDARIKAFNLKCIWKILCENIWNLWKCERLDGVNLQRETLITGVFLSSLPFRLQNVTLHITLGRLWLSF